MSMIHCAKCGQRLSPEQASRPCPNCGSTDRTIAESDQPAGVADKDEVVRRLARRHFQVEAGLTRVFRITGSAEAEVTPSEPIKLLEVNENTPPAGIMPLHFGPAPASGIHYPSIIIEVTPEEFEKIRSHELKLPDGWEIGEELPRPPEGAGVV